MTVEISPKDCRTCSFRSEPNDVDFSRMPCSNCFHSHVTGSKTPWPFWSQRTEAQFRADAKAGHKVKVRIGAST